MTHSLRGDRVHIRAVRPIIEHPRKVLALQKKGPFVALKVLPSGAYS